MRKFSTTHHRSKRSRAQAMVEFALVLPLLLVVIIGIFEFSRLLFAWIILENSTRFGIRYATTGTYDTTYCPGGVCSTDPEVDAARVPSIKDETTRMVLGFFLKNVRYESVAQNDDLYFNVTICSDERKFVPPVQGTTTYASCTLLSDGTTPSEHAGSPGNRVYVAADYNFKFMVMPLFGLGPERIHLASYRLGYVEQFRSARAINTPLPMSIPTSTPSITPTPTNSSTPTETWTPSATSTPAPSATPTFTPSRTPTPTQSLTPTRTLSPTPITPTTTRTPTHTRTPTNTRTPSSTPTITLTPTRTLSPTITVTPSRTLSPTITLTPSRTLSPTITLTPSRTPTRTPSRTPTATSTRTPTRTPSNTPTITQTFTPAPPTNTRTNTPVPSNTPVPTNTTRPPTTAPTNSRTPTRTPTICLDC